MTLQNSKNREVTKSTPYHILLRNVLLYIKYGYQMEI
jgi:hypothetical protein